MGLVHWGPSSTRQSIRLATGDSADVSEDAELPKPSLVKPSNIQELRVFCPASPRCYASEVRENVQLFKEKVEILHTPVVRLEKSVYQRVIQNLQMGNRMGMSQVLLRMTMSQNLLHLTQKLRVRISGWTIQFCTSQKGGLSHLPRGKTRCSTCKTRQRS